MNSIRVGIDIGGTFTDFVVYRPDAGQLETFKLLSTPEDPSEAVLNGLESIAQMGEVSHIEIIHGSTVATNALLERKGARTALITTRGFRDVLQIGRQNRPSLYDLNFASPPPLVEESLRLEVDERVDHHGNILYALEPQQLSEIITSLSLLKPESIAVCLLFSFLSPEHEQLIAVRLRDQGYFVSLSSEILPEYREYERTSTTVVNAYVSPVINRYLSNLESGLRVNQPIGQPHMRIMQSNGGAISPGEARQKGVYCLLSGPAGGIVGSQYVAKQALQLDVASTSYEEITKLITFDMGGTSTDVSLLDGAPKITTEALVGGLPIRIPLMDIHTIGAGGGSIAYVDLGGALRVGPQSAGADPGPACYSRGGSSPTVTDANLVLGRLAPEYFLGGQMRLNFDLARRVIGELSKILGLDSTQVALGIIEVANAHMERALRVISVERGYDPVDFTLLSFGGAGGLHACELARRLGIGRVLIPPYASVLSALGMLAADVIKDYSLTVMLPGQTSPDMIDAALSPLVERSIQELRHEGVHEDQIQIERMLDMRYLGQSYELILPYSDHYIDVFHHLHLQEYGYNRPEAAVEIVNVRVRAKGMTFPPPIPLFPEADPDPAPAYLYARPVTFSDGTLTVPFYRGERLFPGNQLVGPAVVLRGDTTVLLIDKVKGNIDRHGNLWLNTTEVISSELV